MLIVYTTKLNIYTKGSQRQFATIDEKEWSRFYSKKSEAVQRKLQGAPQAPKNEQSAAYK